MWVQEIGEWRRERSHIYGLTFEWSQLVEDSIEDSTYFSTLSMSLITSIQVFFL